MVINMEKQMLLLIDFLKTILVWPVAAVFLGFMLRGSIVKLLERILKIKSPGGGEIEFGIPQPPIAPPLSISGDVISQKEQGGNTVLPTEVVCQTSDDVTQYGYAVLAQIGSSEMLEEQVRILEKDLNNVGHSHDFREKILIHALAKNQIHREFERVLSLIYKSQLLALFSLVNSGNEPQKIEKVQEIYDQAKKDWPGFYENVSFAQWLGFLEISLLLTRTTQGDNGLVLTVRGQDFTSWVLSERRDQVEKTLY